ncbi:hypothetical protein DFP72DRAFT_928336 [Ephemerocybe angulata]|uniref:Uncharacterized protein n=1 Tax=Ephemerocybe angulata TaxID=980116 RepID=A0A8H6LVU4_9AGAR|nr:hypothetical protein DFP72DRAFT_928336 [Tulosesus angulatus]
MLLFRWTSPSTLLLLFSSLLISRSSFYIRSLFLLRVFVRHFGHSSSWDLVRHPPRSTITISFLLPPSSPYSCLLPRPIPAFRRGAHQPAQIRPPRRERWKPACVLSVDLLGRLLLAPWW